MLQLKSKMLEALSSVIPITVIVLLLSVTVVPLDTGTMVLFGFGALLLILGMGFFTLGAEISMQPMGEGIGIQISKSKKVWLSLLVCFILGVLITIAEPDLQVLAEQIPSNSCLDFMLLCLSLRHSHRLTLSPPHSIPAELRQVR